MALAFEQQPKESAKAFAAFSEYLKQGPQRSLAAVAQKVAKCSRLIKRWSKRYDWAGRVQAHADYVAQVEREAIESMAKEKAVEWAKLHETVKREAWREAEETIAMVRKAREDWTNSGRVPGWEGMARMLELAFKLKQFAAGMPSEVKEVRETFTGTLEIDWEIALRKVYGEAVADGQQKPPLTVDVESEPPRLQDAKGSGITEGTENTEGGNQSLVTSAPTGEAATGEEKEVAGVGVSTN